MAKTSITKGTRDIFKDKNLGVKIDLGCGEYKQDGFIGVDIRPVKGVDIVADLEKFPWPIPDECASLVMSSHLLEHLQPHSADPKLLGLAKLLLDKKILTQKEVNEYCGELDYAPVFMRFMDEVWRVLKPDGVFMASFPYATSSGYYQDPTHINQINEATIHYFDPLAPGGLYYIYRPKPWKIETMTYSAVGNMEIVLRKRRIDKSYKVIDTHAVLTKDAPQVEAELKKVGHKK